MWGSAAVKCATRGFCRGRFPARRLVPAPDCGMKYLPRARAFAKLQAMVAGAGRVRADL